MWGSFIKKRSLQLLCRENPIEGNGLFADLPIKKEVREGITASIQRVLSSCDRDATFGMSNEGEVESELLADAVATSRKKVELRVKFASGRSKRRLEERMPMLRLF